MKNQFLKTQSLGLTRISVYLDLQMNQIVELAHLRASSLYVLGRNEGWKMFPPLLRHEAAKPPMRKISH
jgi:hypothetical protein